jgi:DNA-binding SARP family transcriptional activator
MPDAGGSTGSATAPQRPDTARSFELAILGPVMALADGSPIRLGAAKHRMILAALGLRFGEVVSADELIEVLWAGRPPATATKAVQVYVSELRKRIEHGADDTRVVTSHPGGYRLSVEADALDLNRFEGMWRAGRDALADGDARRASEELSGALSIWRGSALADLRYEDGFAADIRRLDDTRAACVEDRIAADLALGDHARLIPELEALVADNPLRERLQEQLMLALYRAGRQADALAAYQDARRTLVDELGIDPSPELAAMERRILQHDPALAAPATLPAAAEVVSASQEGRDRRERKVVSVLAAQLSPAAGTDVEDIELLVPRMRAVAEACIERFGGLVGHSAGGDLRAVFGAPNTREDDPQRAARAGFAIVAEIAEQVPDAVVRIGLDTGEALVSVDGPGDAAGALAGGVAQRAASVQAIGAPGDVLASAAAHRALRGRFVSQECSDAGDGTWRLLRPLPQRSLDAEDQPAVGLVGRTGELAWLTEAFEQACTGRRPALATVVGVPGVGKTRLVSELLARLDADPRGVSWRAGRSLPSGETSVFAPVSEMLKAEAGVLESDPPDEAAAKLSVALAHLIRDEHDRTWLERQVGPLLGLARAVDGVAPVDAFAGWRRLFEAMAMRGPTVLVFEDIHWADDATLDFVQHLVEWTAGVPLLVVCTARPELADRRPDWGGGASTLALGPLSEASTEELVDLVLDGPAVLTSVERASLVERAGGNPLYAQECARLLAHGGGTGGDRPLPETIQGVIGARLDAVGPDDRRLLQAASVLGTVFWLGAAAGLAAVDESDAAAAALRLHQRDLIRRHPTSTVAGETEWSFGHVLVREVAYGRLPRTDRGRMHLVAADWIESVSAGRDDLLDALAHHLLAALEYARASGTGDDAQLASRTGPVVRSAGRRAVALGASPAGCRLLRAAVDLTPGDDPDHPYLLLELGTALFTERAGMPELTQARDAFLALGDPESAALAEIRIATLLRTQGDGHAASELADRAWGRVRDGAPSATRVRVAAMYCSDIAVASRLKEAEAVARDVIAAAPEFGLEEQAANALMVLGMCMTGAGDRDGLGHLRGAVEAQRRLGRPLASSLANLAHGFWQLGDVRSALVTEHEALAAARRRETRSAIDMTSVDLASLAYLTGDWDVAQRSVRPLAVQPADSWYLGPAVRILLGRIAAAQGDARTAGQMAADALSAARHVNDPESLSEALSFAALVAALHADRHDAQRLLAELLDLLERQEAYELAYLVAGDLGRSGLACGMAERIVPVLRPAQENPWAGAAIAFLERRFADSAAAYEEIGSAADAAAARAAAGAALLAAGRVQDGESELETAERFYRSVGAAGELAAIGNLRTHAGEG